MGVKISALPAASAIADANLFALVQGSATNKATWAAVKAAAIAAVQAIVIDTGDYTALPATVGQINFSDTTGLYPGMAIRLEQASVNKYYVITSVTANTSITVGGPPLTLAVTIDEIATLDPSRVVQIDFFFPGGYDFSGDTTGLLNRATQSRFRWGLSRGYLCQAIFSHDTVGTGTQPKVNVSIDSTNVLTDNLNDGVELGGTTAFVSSGNGTMALGDYLVENGDLIEFDLTAGGNNDARDLSGSLLFVLE